jgi:hypothetical protein
VLVLVALTLLHGTVRVGPTSPVCRTGTPCTKPAGRVSLVFAHGTSRVRTTTDAFGRYRVRLAPGTWTLRVGRTGRLTPARFAVPRAATATRNFFVDTGIR